LNLLMREPNPVAITEIAAVTFTNEAATEMKLRLRRELSKLVDHTDESAFGPFQARYHLTREMLTFRAHQALAQLERAQIGTLHSFAAHLLRLHPIESGLDPAFQEDDGSRFREVFSVVWDRWLDDELGQTGRQHDRWREVLAGGSLDDFRHLA